MSNLGKSGIYSSLDPVSGPEISGLFLQYPAGQQYTSFRVGDEGWLIQNGFFNNLNPLFPEKQAQLDRSLGSNYWWRLTEDITVGGASNKLRFTDLNGVQVWGAANNIDKITIDKYLGIGFYRLTADLGGAVNWNTNIDNAQLFSVVAGGVTFDSFFAMTREIILATFGEISENGPGNIQDPISLATIWNKNGASNEFWTSTTQSNGTTNAYSKGWNPSTFVRGNAKTALLLPVYMFDARSLISV